MASDSGSRGWKTQCQETWSCMKIIVSFESWITLFASKSCQICLHSDVLSDRLPNVSCIAECWKARVIICLILKRIMLRCCGQG